MQKDERQARLRRVGILWEKTQDLLRCPVDSAKERGTWEVEFRPPALQATSPAANNASAPPG